MKEQKLFYASQLQNKKLRLRTKALESPNKSACICRYAFDADKLPTQEEIEATRGASAHIYTLFYP